MYAIIRVRGEITVRHDILETLEYLRLNMVNHMSLCREDESANGMLRKVKDYVTWGEIDEATFTEVLEKRGRLIGNKKLDENFLKHHKISSYAQLAKEILEGKKKLADFGIKPVFRLRPPRKGFDRKGVKRPHSEGGALGYRKNEINKLIGRMV